MKTLNVLICLGVSRKTANVSKSTVCIKGLYEPKRMRVNFSLKQHFIKSCQQNVLVVVLLKCIPMFKFVFPSSGVHKLCGRCLTRVCLLRTRLRAGVAFAFQF